ncbi:MAG TPA: hypothetical protein VI300_00230, partial [Solirubrobacter sp.]
MHQVWVKPSCRSLLLVAVVAGAVLVAALGTSQAGAINPPEGQPTGLIPVGPGSVESASRQVVRTPGGRVYIVAVDDGGNVIGGRSRLVVYRASTTGIPSSFAEADTQHEPSASGTRVDGNTLSGGDARLDRNGVIHIAYFDTWATRALYATFDTATDRWATTDEYLGDKAQDPPEFWFGRRGDTPVAIALDADGTPTIAVAGAKWVRVYRRGPSGWDAGTELDADYLTVHPSLTVDRVGRLHAAWLRDTDRAIMYAQRGADGRWSAAQTIDSGADVLDNSNADQSPSIAVDSANDPVVLYLDGTDHVKIRRLVDGTWLDESPPVRPASFSHAPGLFVRGDDVFALLGHDTAIHPAYFSRQAGDSTWSDTLALDPPPGV